MASRYERTRAAMDREVTRAKNWVHKVTEGDPSSFDVKGPNVVLHRRGRDYQARENFIGVLRPDGGVIIGNRRSIVHSMNSDGRLDHRRRLSKIDKLPDYKPLTTAQKAAILHHGLTEAEMLALSPDKVSNIFRGSEQPLATVGSVQRPLLEIFGVKNDGHAWD